VIKVELSNQQSRLDIDSAGLIKAARSVLEAEGKSQASISLAVVDDKTIHALNKRFLSHDYATDVLSFLSSEDDDHLEGEVIVSADTAISSAADYDWPPMHELILYVLHGVLHLAGHDDQTSEDRLRMRELESQHLRALGISPPRDHLMVQQYPSDAHPVEDTKTTLGGVNKP
jgi:probable rRNA maturation factor